MSNIPISQIVTINPRVIGAGGAQGSLDGLLITQSAAVPVGQLQTYYDAQTVADFFGASSDEYRAAQVYFAGIIGGGQQPASLMIARSASVATAAAVFGSRLTLTLPQLQALSGTLIVTTDTTRTSSTINLAGATSFANAASLMTAGFTTPNFAVTYDTARNRFVLATAATGDTATVSAVTGTLATGVGLSAAAGAFQQPTGTGIDTPDTTMTRAAGLSGNWSTFTHAWAADIDDRLLFAEWTSAQQFQFIYAAWDADTAGLTADNPASFGNLVQSVPYQGTVPVYGDLARAMGVLAWSASTNYLMTEGRNTLAFRQPVAGSGTAGILAPDVTTLDAANALLSNGYTYLGRYSSAANDYTIYYNGSIGGQFEWADTFLNQIWLRRTLQQALFETLLAYKSLPYNADGYNAIYQGAQDTISQATANGVIRTGVTLSPSQRALIDSQAGFAIAGEVVDKGWYLQVADPLSTTVRTERGSPTVNFWYCDGGSIQKIVVSSTTVL